MLNEKIFMSLILVQPGKSVTVYLIVSAFVLFYFPPAIRLVLLLQLCWAAKFIVVTTLSNIQ